jgi:hypothetical protein
MPDQNQFPRCSPSVAVKQTEKMMGCYRKGEAEDPEAYVAAVATVLASYPEDVVRRVTHPLHGLPGKIQWLPSVKEIRDACEAEMRPFYNALTRQHQVGEERRLLAAPNKPTPEQRLRGAEYGEAVVREMRNETSAEQIRADAERRLHDLQGEVPNYRPTVSQELLAKFKVDRRGEAA